MPTNPGPPSDSAHAATGAQWTSVAVIAAGVVMAGIALIEWVWAAFWAGIALAVIGAIGAAKAGIMDAVSEWSPAEPMGGSDK